MFGLVFFNLSTWEYEDFNIILYMYVPCVSRRNKEIMAKSPIFCSVNSIGKIPYHFNRLRANADFIILKIPAQYNGS